MKKISTVVIALFSALVFTACKDYGKEQQTTTIDSLINNASMVDSPYLKGARLIAGNDCITCHAVHERMFGPSFEEIAAKYKNKEKLAEYLAQSVIKGSRGIFGNNAMTPHPTLKYNDIIEMTRYILSVKPGNSTNAK